MNISEMYYFWMSVFGTSDIFPLSLWGTLSCSGSSDGDYFDSLDDRFVGLVT